jgi:hypothetical protein
MQLACRFDNGSKGGERERAADRHPADPGGRELRHRRRPREGQDVDGTVHRGDELADVLQAAEARRVEDVGAGLLIGLEPTDID